MFNAESVMTGGHGAHFDLAVALYPKNRRSTALRELAAPFAVGVDHELGHQRVDRRSAVAPRDRDAVIRDTKDVFRALLDRGLVPPPCPFKLYGEFPENAQRLGMD